MTLAQNLCNFIQASPTPFHAVSEMAARLEAAGFIHQPDDKPWQIKAGGRYYFTRNDSSLIALKLGEGDLSEQGIHMVGAHTDSPCLKIKPNPELVEHGNLRLGVEVYGGALLNPWFDRDLSIAGRVAYQDKQGALDTALINFQDAVAFIPSLAIHLDREANNTRTINKQTDLPPLVLQTTDEQTVDFKAMLMTQLLAENPDLKISAVLDYELCLYDTQQPAVVGLEQDYIASARLDNLLSCYTGLQALLDSQGQGHQLLICTDHEEVGSASAAGACGPFLESTLLAVSEALGLGHSAHQRMLAQSMMISADNAHAIHPNFPDRHDGKHGPLMNAGPVIKYNANQRYATNSTTGALFRKLCDDCDVPCQSFVVRSDMGCGSTIGPAIATELGIDTIDIGVPTLGMHSIREMAGSRDLDLLHKVLQHYYTQAD